MAEEALMDKEKDGPEAKKPDQAAGNQGPQTDSSKSKKAKGRKKTDPDDKHNRQIKELEKKNDELNDKYLRLYSEFDNYRKRTMREKTELSKTASEDVISRLLPVLDDFERGLKSTKENGSKEDTLREGMELIYNKLISILNQKGLEPITSIGETFDVDFHEAVTNIPSPSEEMKGKVVDEIEKGYLLNGKVIRYAKVVVGN